MSNIAEFENIPKISFIDNLTAENVRDNLLAGYKKEVKAVTGQDVEISAGSPERLMLNAMAAQLWQGYKFVDNAAKQGLLKYSTGDYLDNLGLLRGLKRRPAEPASCMIKFTLSDARPSATYIPAGTRLSAGSLYFYTKEYLEIPAGQLEGEVTALAEEAGTASNGLQEGDIQTLVDSIAYIGKVENTTPTTGGTDIETDDSFTLRIYECPAGYSVAGPYDAYRFHAREAVSDIGDVEPYSPEPGAVEVVFTMSDGSLPGEEKLLQVKEALSAEDIRPLCDKVSVKGPEEVSYNIELTYYIGRSNSSKVSAIQEKISEAIQVYKQWQRHLGRDVTASQLIALIMGAGAKRVEVTAPTFQSIEKAQLPKLESESVTYGGLEDD